MPFLVGSDSAGVFQSLLNAVFGARTAAQTAATTATTKAGEAASSATTASGHATQAATYRDQSRGWAEGVVVVGLPDAEPESRSSKGWSEQSKGFRDQAAALVESAAGVAQAHGSAVSLARALMGDAVSVWGHAGIVDDVVVTNGTWTPVVGGLGPTLTMQAGVGTLTRTFDLDASPETNPLAALGDSAALYLIAEEPWVGVVRVRHTYHDDANNILGGGTGVVVRDRALVMEEMDVPDGATGLTVTITWQIEDDAEIAGGALVLAPFVGLSAMTTLGGGGEAFASRRLALVERPANTLITAAYSGTVLVFTDEATCTMPDTLPRGFQFEVVNRAGGSKVVTFAASEVVNPSGTKLEADGWARVVHLGDGAWMVGGLLTT